MCPEKRLFIQPNRKYLLQESRYYSNNVEIKKVNNSRIINYF